ncbi:uncharacterized protein LOC143469813 isoform X3 [Clavelina lepadiformis]|uniref:uncharacterized protein LOC143469813 isoform X3 n=1 Tax=Clavelina lepadiformis TaxID=159417 RepID=UPI004041AF94
MQIKTAKIGKGVSRKKAFSKKPTRASFHLHLKKNSCMRSWWNRHQLKLSRWVMFLWEKLLCTSHTRLVCIRLHCHQRFSKITRLRALSYSSTDVFLVLFSVVDRQTFGNVTNKWVPEVRHYVPDAKILLVGMQCDLKTDPEVVAKLCKKKLKPVSAYFQLRRRPAVIERNRSCWIHRMFSKDDGRNT